MKVFNYLVTLVLLFNLGCGSSDGTSTGNPAVAVVLKSYNSTLTVTSLKMCFKRLRFKQTNVDQSSGSDSNIDLELGEVTIDSSGTSLGEINIPVGTYERIEFDLDSDCLSGNSIEVQNSNGTFMTNDSIKIKFIGLITIDANSSFLELGVQDITSAMNTVTMDSEIKTKAEAASGDF